MASEKTIRQHCKQTLVEDGWVVCTPNKSRYGSLTITWESDFSQGDDLFNIFDLIGWRADEMLFVQYTTKGNTAAREKKVDEFMSEFDVTLPDGCTAEIWGYKNQSGGEFEITEV